LQTTTNIITWLMAIMQEDINQSAWVKHEVKKKATTTMKDYSIFKFCKVFAFTHM
jgi:hypothetical protein